ncbi:STAS domain-containing protein [Fictibacillus sp. b24]|uniref:STAS domain-containing protein n=1 Tax=Fictibacillus sp. b24 TaxID=3055863 RepID=UPI0025A21D43|nr:STAS domain-containing protein [Fictibacillus sp. b24]MDM5317048.1 STAS domain-containing protein [Fictibacillus sp. b24]
MANLTQDRSIALYEFIIQHSTNLTDSWLASRDVGGHGIYSKRMGAEVEKRLREQNQFFIKMIASIFNEKNELLEDIDAWAKRVAEDRAGSNTPIHETIQQFKRFRNIFWNKIREFIENPLTEVSQTEILTWSSLLHSTFDTVIERFAEEYNFFTSRRIEAQQDMIYQLSSPVIPLSDFVGILPLVGEIDTHRAKWIMESTLQQCTDTNITQLFIDLSGVVMIDTMVANEIFQLVNTLKLIGVQSIISGIRPEVAQTSVQLGIDFSQIPTQSTLKQALKSNRIIIEKISL